MQPEISLQIEQDVDHVGLHAPFYLSVSPLSRCGFRICVCVCLSMQPVLKIGENVDHVRVLVYVLPSLCAVLSCNFEEVNGEVQVQPGTSTS